MKASNFFLIISLIASFSCKDNEADELLQVHTGLALEVTAESAQLHGLVPNLGQGIEDHGICWAQHPNPTLKDNKISLGAAGKPGDFIAFAIDLQPATTYFFAAYIKTRGRLVYGKVVEFTTSGSLAHINTREVTEIQAEAAVGGGVVQEDGGLKVNIRGLCWSTTPNPTVEDNKTEAGSGTGTYAVDITGLEPGTKYYTKAYAINGLGISYGNEVVFTTLATLPVLGASELGEITCTGVIVNASVISDGGSDVAERGICWSTAKEPTISDNTILAGDGTGSFDGSASGLLPFTTYYLRAFATNVAGTVYGEQLTFTSSKTIQFNPELDYGDVTDIEGNVYKTIRIGGQVWMAENLRTSTYNDGVAIPTHHWLSGMGGA
jgi:FlaG/FlaF family flagellin (archaellin)